MSIFWQKLKSRIGAFWRREVPTRHAPVDVKYKEYVCLIEPKSSFLTPLQADTLWAALMWTHYYLHGDEQKTRKLVESNPPQILVSDGFPYEYLPKPKNFIPIERIRKIALDLYGNDWEKQLIVIEIAKRLAEQRFLPVELVCEMLKGKSQGDVLKRCLGFKSEDSFWCPKVFVDIQSVHNRRFKEDISKRIQPLIEDYCNAENCDALQSWRNRASKRNSQHACMEILNSEILRHTWLLESRRTWKNRIDRTQMRALDSDGLYSQQEDYFLDNAWWIFIRTYDFTKQEIEDLFKHLADYGYGRRKSVGKGQFVLLEEIEAKNDEHYIEPDESDADGFMTLSSSYVPQEGEYEDSRYTFHIKRGKVDGDLAMGGTPFLKCPIAMYEAGSVFETNQFRDYYGKRVTSIHPKPIAQYGYAYPVRGKFFANGGDNNG